MTSTDRDELDFRALFAMLWRGRWFIVGVTLFFTAAAVAAVLLAPKKYTAIVVISPVSSSKGSMGGLGGLASQFGGLASLAGISIGGDSSKMETLAVLQSGELIERFVQDNNLLPVLYAQAWDSEKKRWLVTDPESMPTLWKATQYFRKIRVVTEDKRTGLYSMSITWTDPKIAAQWANALVRLTNTFLREQKIVESERNIAYLKEEADKTAMVQMRSAIYNVMESEIQTVMLAKGSEEFALRTVDRAVAPERPTTPQPTIWIAFGFLFGGAVSVAFLILRRAWLTSAN
jgi:uncharacterized protein involved in exopolysaccharide biosynthesis